MVHEDEYELEGKHGVTQNLVRQHEREERLWASLMGARTCRSAIYWRALSNEETFFTPDVAVTAGLVHGVLPVKEKA